MNTTSTRSQILRANAWANRYLLLCVASFAAILIGITLAGFAEHTSDGTLKMALYFIAIPTALFGMVFAAMSLLAHDEVSRRAT